MAHWCGNYFPVNWVMIRPSHTLQIPGSVDDYDEAMDIDWSKSQVNADQCQQLKNLVSEFSYIFVDQRSKRLVLTNKATCKTDISPGSKSTHKYIFHLHPPANQEINKIVAQQIKQGLILETDGGGWASPALLLKEASGRFHFVIEYQAINTATILQVICMPDWVEMFNCVVDFRAQFFQFWTVHKAFIKSCQMQIAGIKQLLSPPQANTGMRPYPKVFVMSPWCSSPFFIG